MGLQILKEELQRCLGPKTNNVLEMKKMMSLYLDCPFGFANLAWFVLDYSLKMMV